jgi:hypothetical protein
MIQFLDPFCFDILTLQVGFGADSEIHAHESVFHWCMNYKGD